MKKLYLKKQPIVTDLGKLVPAAFLAESITKDIISFPSTFASERLPFDTQFIDEFSGINLERDHDIARQSRIVAEPGLGENYAIAQTFIEGFLISLKELKSLPQRLYFSTYNHFLLTGLYKANINKSLCIPMLREEDFDFYSKLELDFADDEFRQQFIQDLIFLISPRISKKLATEIRRMVKDCGGKPRKNVMWFDLDVLFRSPIVERGIKVLKSSFKERVIEDFLQEEKEKLPQEEPELDESASIEEPKLDEVVANISDEFESEPINLINTYPTLGFDSSGNFITSSQEEEES